MDWILGERPTGCPFCDLAQREDAASLREGLVLTRSEHAIVCLNRYPFSAGHLLVLSRRHLADLSDLEDAEYDDLMRVTRHALARLRSALGPDGVNLGFNLGQASGAGIEDHVHAHLVPRWNGDSNFMPVLADVRVMPEHLDATWTKLRPFFEEAL
jgi:ATP adenylyltransferase